MVRSKSTRSGAGSDSGSRRGRPGGGPAPGGDGDDWASCVRRGDLAAAWAISDRLRAERPAPGSDQPRHLQEIWNGEPLDGRRVLVRCYHGLGDTIQFIRYAPMVRAVAREVIVWAQPPLLPLLATVHGIDRLLPLHDGVPEVEYDVDVEVMELPYVFRTTLASIPRAVPYIHVRPAELPGMNPRVGLVWRSGGWDERRSIPFEILRPLLDIPHVTWLSLQQHRDPADTDPRLADVSDDDVGEAAARMRGLDLLITVDSMPAHLAGALAVPVWTLLTAGADWRWMDDRDDSPWYPTMRLFRQKSEGDWGSVVAEVARSLLTLRRG